MPESAWSSPLPARAAHASVTDDPAPAAGPDTLDQEFLLGLVGHTSRMAFAAIRPHFQRDMAPHGLRPSEFAVLSLLAANPGTGPKRLAEAITVSPPNMATILNGLVTRGLIRRGRQAADQRAQALTLTDEGARLYEAAARTVERLERGATAMLTEAERAELLRLLRKVAGK